MLNQCQLPAGTSAKRKYFLHKRLIMKFRCYCIVCLEVLFHCLGLVQSNVIDAEDISSSECVGSVQFHSRQDLQFSASQSCILGLRVTTVVKEGCGCFRLHEGVRGAGRSVTLLENGEHELSIKKVKSLFKISCNDEIELEESGETVLDDQTCFHTVAGSNFRKLVEIITREEMGVTAGYSDFEGNTTYFENITIIEKDKFANFTNTSLFLGDVTDEDKTKIVENFTKRNTTDFSPPILSNDQQSDINIKTTTNLKQTNRDASEKEKRNTEAYRLSNHPPNSDENQQSSNSQHPTLMNSMIVKIQVLFLAFLTMNYFSGL